MKALQKTISIVLILLIAIYLSIYIFVWTSAKGLLSHRLAQELGQEVSVGSVYLIPPYSIVISDFRIKDLFVVDKVIVEPSIAGLLAGQRGLNKLWLFRPSLSLVRLDNTGFNLSEIIDNIISRRGDSPGKSGINFFIKEAIIEEGRIHLDDKITGLSFGIVPLELSVITSLKDFKTRINLEAPVVSDDKQVLGNIVARGCLKKDMQAKFYVNDAEITYFSPYFKSFAQKVRSGKMFFTADMVSRDNDLSIECHLETQDLKFSDEESLLADSQDKKFALFGNLSGIVFDTLIGPGGGGIFDFSIRTKFDRPRLEGLQFAGNLFQGPIENIFKQSPEQGIETIKKMGKDFESIGREFKQQFEGIGDMFKKQAKEGVDVPTDTQPSQKQENLPAAETAQ
jgi:hypothetical protein